MKSFAPLTLLASVGYAQTATLSSIDVFGNTIASSSIDYIPGEEFMGTLDLGINAWSLKEIQLNTGTYGVDQCEFFMQKSSYHGKTTKWASVGSFADMCEWPNFVSTLMYFNVENIPQFKYGNTLAVKCMAQEVTFKKNSKNIPCSGNEDLTAQNNQLANPYTNFNFEAMFDSKNQMSWDTGLIYFSNLADIFLHGLNPVLDLIWVGINEGVYQENFERLAKAYGYGGKGHMTRASKNEAATQEDINEWLSDIEEFGFMTYGLETLVQAYPIYENFQDLEWSAFNDYIFEFAEYSETEFGSVINNGLTYKDEWWTDLNWYYRLEIFA